MTSVRYDLAVVGAGLVGLAHALAANRRGLKTIVLERDRQPAGRSLRDAGIVCPAGQTAGTSWLRARRSAALWNELGRLADIEVVPQGLLALAQRPRRPRCCATSRCRAWAKARCRWIGPNWNSACPRWPRTWPAG